MKHTCKNCIYCNLISKDANGFKTLCKYRPNELIPGTVERCIMKTTAGGAPCRCEDYKTELTILQNSNFMGNIDLIEKIKNRINKKGGR